MQSSKLFCRGCSLTDIIQKRIRHIKESCKNLPVIIGRGYSRGLPNLVIKDRFWPPAGKPATAGFPGCYDIVHAWGIFVTPLTGGWLWSLPGRLSLPGFLAWRYHRHLARFHMDLFFRSFHILGFLRIGRRCSILCLEEFFYAAAVKVLRLREALDFMLRDGLRPPLS